MDQVISALELLKVEFGKISAERKTFKDDFEEQLQDHLESRLECARAKKQVQQLQKEVQLLKQQIKDIEQRYECCNVCDVSYNS